MLQFRSSMLVTYNYFYHFLS